MTSHSWTKFARGTTCGLAAAFSLIVLLGTDTAHAYVGPGAGLTAIGTVLALFAALMLAVVGFVWYPMKRVMSRRKAARTKSSAGADIAESGSGR